MKARLEGPYIQFHTTYGFVLFKNISTILIEHTHASGTHTQSTTEVTKSFHSPVLALKKHEKPVKKYSAVSTMEGSLLPKTPGFENQTPAA